MESACYYWNVKKGASARSVILPSVTEEFVKVVTVAVPTFCWVLLSVRVYQDRLWTIGFFFYARREDRLLILQINAFHKTSWSKLHMIGYFGNLFSCSFFNQNHFWLSFHNQVYQLLIFAIRSQKLVGTCAEGWSFFMSPLLGYFILRGIYNYSFLKATWVIVFCESVV